ITLVPTPSWLDGVAYDAQTRRHRLDGRPVPSVTQVLDRAYPDRFACVAPDVLAAKAALGTAVHAAVANGWPNGGPACAADVAVRLDAWRWFCTTRRVQPLLREAVVCSRDLGLPPARRRPYVGRLDGLCTVDGRRVVLLDLKTGETSLAHLQTLAYLDALYQQYPQLIAVDVERWAVVLDEDGSYGIEVYRGDSLDASDFRAALEKAYASPDTEWTVPMPENPLFDLPDVEDAGFDLPDEDAVPAVRSLEVTVLSEPVISPTADVYVTQLEAFIGPYERTAQQFADDMAAVAIDTPHQLAWLGQQSLVAKEREQLLDELFDPAIRPVRTFLDRVYAVKRRVMQHVKAGGETAARRYTLRKRELDEIDRRARLEAERRQREAQLEADRVAAMERQRLAEAATTAAQAGDASGARALIDAARAVEAAPVPVESPPVPLASVAAVPGLGTREGWAGAIVDMKIALLASARPDLYREVAALITSGDLTPAGGSSLTTQLISDRLRALASELPVIPSSMFSGNDKELKARATADRDTLQWPGFTFTQTQTPVRRTLRART
ncbi:MAG TPA: hypothetical protein VIX63_15240, partial [Vicinamibacterales bacterium]